MSLSGKQAAGRPQTAAVDPVSLRPKWGREQFNSTTRESGQFNAPPVQPDTSASSTCFTASGRLRSHTFLQRLPGNCSRPHFGSALERLLETKAKRSTATLGAALPCDGIYPPPKTEATQFNSYGQVPEAHFLATHVDVPLFVPCVKRHP